jgi:hypothetical protein
VKPEVSVEVRAAAAGDGQWFFQQKHFQPNAPEKNGSLKNHG